MANQLIKKNLGSNYSVSDAPKLVNGYGEVFDYKNSDKAQLASEKIHQKKLNLERENRKLKLAKKTEKLNYYKLKNTSKITLKSEINSCKYKYKSQKSIIDEINKYSKILIPLEDFIKTEISNIDDKVKYNYKLAVKTMKSMRYSDDENEVITQKIKSYHTESIADENKLLSVKQYLQSLESIDLTSYVDTPKELVKFVNESVIKPFTEFKSNLIKFIKDHIVLDMHSFCVEFDKFIIENNLTSSTMFVKSLKKLIKSNVEGNIESILPNIDGLAGDLTFYSSICEKTLNNIAKGYKSQSYFKYQDKNIDYENKVKKLKEEYSTGLKSCKKNYKETLHNELDRINNKCKDGKRDGSDSYKLYVNEVKIKELENDKKNLDKEIKSLAKEKQQTIKYIKDNEKILYKNAVKQYKQSCKEKVIEDGFKIITTRNYKLNQKIRNQLLIYLNKIENSKVILDDFFVIQRNKNKYEGLSKEEINKIKSEEKAKNQEQLRLIKNEFLSESKKLIEKQQKESEKTLSEFNGLSKKEISSLKKEEKAKNQEELKLLKQEYYEKYLDIKWKLKETTDSFIVYYDFRKNNSLKTSGGKVILCEKLNKNNPTNDEIISFKKINNENKEIEWLIPIKKKVQTTLTFSWGGNKSENIEKSNFNTSLKLFFSHKLRSLNAWEYKADLLDIKINYLKDVGSAIDKLTYDGEFKSKTAEALVSYNESKRQNCSDLQSALDSVTLLGASAKMSQEDKESFETQKSKYDTEYKEAIASLHEKKASGEISKQAYKNESLKLKIFHKEDVKAIKNTLDSVKDKYISKDLLIKFNSSQKMANKELAQAKNNISKEVPIEYKKYSSIWMTMIAFILPGLDQLILKNWKKAFWMLILTVICWAVFIPYAFGVGNLQGNGIVGLVKLSWPIKHSVIYGDLYSDSRYALVEGVTGVIMLVIAISYFIISAYQCWKITRNMEKGIRCNTWLETKKILRTTGFPYAISLPGLFLIAFIVIMPIIVSLLMAFTNIGTEHLPSSNQETNWVGFEQFKRIFADYRFYQPLGNILWWNIVWAVATTLLVLLLGTVMALAIENRNIKCKAMWRTIFILPWAIPAFVSILFFKIIFSNGSTGMMNRWLTDWGIIQNAVDWQTGPIASRIILILIQGWLGHSYIVLLVSGNLKSISSDIYEAASIDGAKPHRQFWKITMPIVLIQIAPLLIGQFTFNFNNFSIIWLFNDGGSKIDPSYVYDAGNCDILLSWIFKITFGGSANSVPSNQALASALVIVMSFFVVTASGIGFARSKAFRKGEEV